LGLSGTRVRRTLFIFDAEKVADTKEGWELAVVHCRPLLSCRDGLSEFDFDCNEQSILQTISIYMNMMYM